MYPANYSRFPRLAFFYALLLPALLSAADEPSPASATATASLEELLRPYAVHEARLSPDGKHLAATSADKDGARSLVIMDLPTGKADVIKHMTRLNVGRVWWINDSDLVFSHGDGDQYAYQLFHAKLSRLKNTTRFSVGQLTNVIGLPRARPNRALVWIVDGDTYNQIVEMNTDEEALKDEAAVKRIRSTAVKTYSPPKPGIPIGWLALENGELGYGITYQAKKSTLHRYDASNERWVALDIDLDRYRIAGVDPDLHSLWVSHHEEGQGFLLQRYDPVAGAFGEPVWRDSTYDLGTASLHFSKKSGQLVALSYNQRRLFTKCLQEPYLSAQKLVQQKYPEADISLVSHDDADTKLLYRVESPQDPGRIVLLDVTGRSLETMSEVAPWLKGKTLQPTYPFGYTTRDGLKEQGYLTLPAGASATNKVPMIVLVHGGPWLRDKWSFNPLVQFLTSRGYAAMQPNYRGSKGYLPAISFTDRYTFKKMHDDITDATRNAAAMEMIDGQRVAIMGQNFGGFLALMGASLEPGVYSGAVSIDGSFDWEEIVKELRDYPSTRGDYEQLRDFLGKPGKDRETFAEYSPLKQAGAIRAPVFLAFDEDPNQLSTQQSKELAATLKRQGTACETFSMTSGSHDLRGVASSLDMYRRIEVFLAQNVGKPAAK